MCPPPRLLFDFCCKAKKLRCYIAIAFASARYCFCFEAKHKSNPKKQLTALLLLRGNGAPYCILLLLPGSEAKSNMQWAIALLRSKAKANCILLLPLRQSKSNVQLAIAFASKQSNGLLRIAFASAQKQKQCATGYCFCFEAMQWPMAHCLFASKQKQWQTVNCPLPRSKSNSR